MEAMLPRKLQPENAKSPMLVQSLGNVKEVRLLQPRKAARWRPEPVRKPAEAEALSDAQRLQGRGAEVFQGRCEGR